MDYSVVVPILNEAENIESLVAELEGVMSHLQGSWELIYVDDGSTDSSLQLLQNLQETKPFLHIISFDRNYGQSSAFDAGFRAAKGRLVITMDGDGQNDPMDIPRMIQATDDAELVCGHRQDRQDTLGIRLISKIANRIRSFVCHDGVPDSGCSLKVYTADALAQIKLFDGMHRFLPALFLLEGFRISVVPVAHRPRSRGQSKYNFFNRNINTIFDMLAVLWMRKRRLRYQLRQK